MREEASAYNCKQTNKSRGGSIKIAYIYSLCASKTVGSRYSRGLDTTMVEKGATCTGRRTRKGSELPNLSELPGSVTKVLWPLGIVAA